MEGKKKESGRDFYTRMTGAWTAKQMAPGGAIFGASGGALAGLLLGNHIPNKWLKVIPVAALGYGGAVGGDYLARKAGYAIGSHFAGKRYDAKRREPNSVPLSESDSKDAFTRNFKAELAAGKPKKQALAIAYSVQRKAKKSKGDKKVKQYEVALSEILQSLEFAGQWESFYAANPDAKDLTKGYAKRKAFQDKLTKSGGPSTGVNPSFKVSAPMGGLAGGSSMPLPSNVRTNPNPNSPAGIGRPGPVTPPLSTTGKFGVGGFGGGNPSITGGGGNIGKMLAAGGSGRTKPVAYKKPDMSNSPVYKGLFGSSKKQGMAKR